MGEGYIKLSRKLFNSDMWETPRTFSSCEAWIDLIQSARFEATPLTASIGGREITYGRGQYPASIRFLATRWKWSEKQVRSFIERLKKQGRITTECKQGMNIVTLCKYDEYNGGGNTLGTAKGTAKGTDTKLIFKELDRIRAQVEAQQRAQEGHSEGTKKNKAKTEKKIKEKTSTIVDAKDVPNGDTCAEAPAPPEKPLKTWKEDFNVYRQELDIAYAALVADNAFIAERQTYHRGVDILLSMEKAYKDYWSTEVGWKKKKAARSKGLDWKRTFVNALSLGSNQVRQSAGKSAYVPVTESQKKFTEYLNTNAPLMLNMPVQPTDEEIAELRKIKPSVMLSIVSDINNNRYLTNGRNSVYQTIMEIKQKQ